MYPKNRAGIYVIKFLFRFYLDMNTYLYVNDFYVINLTQVFLELRFFSLSFFFAPVFYLETSIFMLNINSNCYTMGALCLP